MKPMNLLVVFSDQHTRDLSGCYGHPVIKTPNIDRIAERGTLFSNAYTTCPICVPARASLATGRYVHQIGYWDNGIAYDGRVGSWHHRLRENGIRVDSVGKLHFRSSKADNGFTEEIDPLHVVDEVGDTLGSIRDDPPFRKKRGGIIEAGPGDSTYIRYDASNADHACRWISERAADRAPKPWALFLGFVLPHPRYIAPESYFRLYASERLPLLPQWQPEEWPDHPAIEFFRRYFDFAEPFGEEVVRRLNAAYYGACTYLDHQIGRVLDALERSGQAEETRIIYTTDHGESLGARGLFGKFTMYEESSAIPLVIAGPDVPAGGRVETPVSLVDIYPSVLEALGVPLTEEERSFPGRSLWTTALEPDRDRIVFSEYHALGSRAGFYMLRDRRRKYVYYVGARPQLFDLVEDPMELNDLAGIPESASLLEEFESHLRGMLDPEEIDRQAKADQARAIEACGGRDAVIRRGSFDNSPVPGEEPIFH
jgi:choline-sulfatase